MFGVRILSIRVPPRNLAGMLARMNTDMVAAATLRSIPLSVRKGMQWMFMTG